MLEHGSFRLELQGAVLHVYPVGGFNEFGIEALHQEIRRHAPSRESWVLVEHPGDKAGLTLEAIGALCDNYRKLSQIGCKAIGLEISPLWERSIKRIIDGELDIPVYFNGDSEGLMNRVCAHL